MQRDILSRIYAQTTEWIDLEGELRVGIRAFVKSWGRGFEGGNFFKVSIALTAGKVVLRAAILVAALFPIHANGQDLHIVSGAVETSTGAAIEGAVVSAFPEDSLGEVAATTSTDASGNFVLEVETGSFAIVAEPDRAGWYPYTVYPDIHCLTDSWQIFEVTGDLPNIDFSIEAGGKLDVTLFKADGGVVDTPVVPYLTYLDDQGHDVGWHSFGAIENGRFLSPPLPVGAFVIAFDGGEQYPRQYYCGTLRESDAETISTLRENTRKLDDCTLIEGAKVIGRVVDTGGAGIPDVMVTASVAETQPAGFAVSGPDGSFSITVPEDGDVKLRAQADPTTPYVSHYYPDTTLWSEAEWVSTSSAGVDIVLPIGGKLRFQLVDKSGGPPVADILLGFFWKDLAVDAVSYVHASPSGEVVSGALDPGQYKVEVLPDENSPYISHRLCSKLAFPDIYEIEGIETIDGGSCEVLRKEYLPHTSSGLLFSYDAMWKTNPEVNPYFLIAALACEDLDGDGLIDVVVSGTDAESGTPSPELPTYGNTIFVLENRGGGFFEDQTDAWVPFLYKGGPRDIELCDVDGDDRPDLVMGNWPEPLDRPWGEKDGIWKNVDSEYFENKTDAWMPPDDPLQYGFDDRLGPYTHCISVADLNNDGALDIFRGSEYEQVLLNDGTGKMVLAPPSTGHDGSVGQNVIWQGWGLALHDFNQDGNQDAIFASSPIYPSGDYEGDHHIIWLGRGDGTFYPIPKADAPPTILDESARVPVGYQPIIDDFDGNGLYELYVANLVYAGELVFPSPTMPLDQLIEIIPTESDIPDFRDISDRIDQNTTYNDSWHVTSGDIDNDGDIDIVVSNPTWAAKNYLYPEIRILINDGTGRFELMDERVFPSFAGSPGQVLVFDADLDGDLDLFAGTWPDNVVLKNMLLERFDLDGDRYVTTLDASTLLDAFGTRAAGAIGDTNLDGVVDPKDLSMILRYQTSAIIDNVNYCKCGR